MTVATPSAKAHERVTGRWIRDFEITNPREWTIYYFKQIIGTPIPWLVCAYAASAFLSRAGVEIAAWICAVLTLLYIVIDRASQNREFKFFRAGCDVWLLSYVFFGFIAAIFADSYSDSLQVIGGVRWVLLLYVMAYCWELFPGLNRVFGIMFFASLCAAGYGIWQHFTGVDLLNNAELAGAPAPGTVFFTPVSFFDTPEHFGTALAMALPFSAAAYLLDERREERVPRYVALLLSMVLLLAILWTYRPGIWLAAGGGLLIAILMRARHGFKLVVTISIFIATVLTISYGSLVSLSDSIEKSETARGERQRLQINNQVQLWEKNPWLGAGQKAIHQPGYDSATGNVYFQVLGQSGIIGAALYLFIILGFLLATYQIFSEIPRTHYWHRVFVSGSLSAQISFHVAGLYWSTLTEALALNLFVLILSGTSYLAARYHSGLVPDDHAI